MSEPNEHQKRTPGRRISVTLTGYILVLILLVEILVIFFYFGIMSLLILVGPGSLESAKLIALGIHLIVATLCCVSLFGVGLCFFGVILRKSLVKWLLITLSILGVLSLPIAIIHEGQVDLDMLQRLYYLAGWSMLLLITTLVAFKHMDSNSI